MATLRMRTTLPSGTVRLTAPRRVARLLRRIPPGILLALTFLVAITTVAFVPRVVARHDPLEVEPEVILLPPTLAHPFGTDQLGRDILSRVAHGARISLGFATLATVISITMSTGIGIVVAFRGGRLDNLVMRLVDILMAFPGILLALIMISLLGPGLVTTMIAVGFGQTPAFVRIVRATTLVVTHQAYVEAARAVGAPELRILRRHILPNVAHTVLVLATLGFSGAILIGSSLSFLGLGAQPPAPEWGSMLGSARSYIGSHWWVATLPGSVLAATLLSINVLGDRLRDILDPRLMFD